MLLLGVELLSLVLILWMKALEERSKITISWECMVNLPNGTYYGLNSREEATLNSQFISETHGSHLAYMSYLENELKMVRKE